MLFQAMGYWVPDDYLVFFDPARLEIRDGATYRTDSGDERQILREDVDHWKAEYPQPAFARMDAADAFWAASIAAKFTDETIRAIVRTGQISDARADTYLADTIIMRRNKVVAYRISRTNPLDAFVVRSAGAGDRWWLAFDNAAICAGAARPGAAYRIRWSRLDNLTGREEPVGDEVGVEAFVADVPETWGPPDDVGDRYLIARISEHADFPEWREPVEVALRRRAEQVEVVGILRPR